MRLTPNHLEVLVHCHAVAGPHPRLHAPAVQDAIYFFHRNDIITPTKGDKTEYRTTDKGRAFLEMLLRTPFPKIEKQTLYLDPRTNEPVGKEDYDTQLFIAQIEAKIALDHGKLQAMMEQGWRG